MAPRRPRVAPRRWALRWLVASSLSGFALGSGAAGQGAPRDGRGAAGPAPVDSLAARLQRDIPGWMRDSGVPGLNVVVLREGAVAWAASFGFADPATGRPMTRDAVFRVESISKPVTAWGVARLAQSRALDLDAPVQDRLHSWSPPPGTPPFTPRELLSHTAGVGLGDFTARYDPGGAVPDVRASLEAEFEMVGAPAERFAYSDTGYNLLELLIQDVTGEDFGAWMRREVLVPLGMHEASFDWDPGVGGRVPTAHTLRNRPVSPYVYPGRASGGLLATVDDVASFARAGMARSYRGGAEVEVLPDSARAALHAPVVRPSGLYGLVAQGYGLGHFTETLSDGRRAVWHGGQGYGWMTHLHLVPESGDAVVLLANSQRAWPLFAHVLGAWSQDLGVAPVRMARIAWAGPVARVLIVMMLLLAAYLLFGVARRRGGDLGRRAPGPPRWRRVLGAAAGASLLGAVLWASSQEYLFVRSVLPGLTPWLGAALVALGLALLVSALVGPPGPTRVAAVLAACALIPSASPCEAQEPLVEVEARWLPTAPVEKTISEPAREATVSVVRGALFVPLVVRGDRTFFVPRLSGSRVGVSPRPVDPAEPVWVEALYDFDLELVLQRELSAGARMTLLVSPGIASDLHGVGWDHATLQGAALYNADWGPGGSWGLGASVSNRFGEVLVLPLVAFQWQGERAGVDVLVPAAASFLWSLPHGLEIGVRVDVDGNVYALGRAGTLEGGRVRYSVLDVGPTLDVPLSRDLRLSISAGASLRRRLEVEDAGGTRVEDATLRPGAHVRIGLAWLPRATPDRP